MGSFATAAKNTMLDALTVDRIQLHSGDPGAAGTDNAVLNAASGSTMVAATFDAASGGERLLQSDVAYTGASALTAAQAVTYVSFWSYNGGSPVFHGSSALSGDQAANASGEYTVKATTTKLTLT